MLPRQPLVFQGTVLACQLFVCVCVLSLISAKMFSQISKPGPQYCIIITCHKVEIIKPFILRIFLCVSGLLCISFHTFAAILNSNGRRC